MKYCVISGNRADRAALTPVAAALNAVWIHVATLHSRDRFDSAIGCGQAMMVAAEKLNNLKPDLVIVAGDRFEILGAACAAYLMSIPIAHLSGGDITEGSQDDAMRHAITKLAALHFPTTHVSAKHLRDMGEERWRIHMVGAPQIDYLLQQELYSFEETLSQLGYAHPELLVPDFEYILVAYQPPTMADDPTTEIDSLLNDLSWRGLPCIFTTINTDAGGCEIERKIIKFCLPGTHLYKKMDHKLFLSAMKHCQYMIGNSSAGFYEAPTLGTKFVNIGNRQTGRAPVTGDGKAAQRIKATLDAMMLVPKRLLLQKKYGEECSMPPGSTYTTQENGVLTLKKSWSDGPVKQPQAAASLTLDQGKEPLHGS